jgi:5-methylcytosine-specific restriction endonuclease McrA
MAESKKEKTRLRAQAWREANRERHRAYSREYRRTHAVEQYAKNREWALANPDKVKAAHKRSIQKHPEAYKASWAKWRMENANAKRMWTATRRAKIRSTGEKITYEDWVSICNSYGNRCLRCGEQKPLSMDHIMPIAWGGRHQISNLQPLCRECNSSKGARWIDYRGFYENKF